ncbi:MAG: YaaR family protein [Spirochaetales bacterium]|nr:YaaR family protein [Spirochaetales bacterium]
MAKIALPDPLLTGLVPGLSGRKTEKKKEPVKAATFRSALAEASQTELTPAAEGVPFSEAEAAELLDAVHASGEELKRDPNADNVRAYKAAVRNFVHYVVDRAYDVSEKTSGGNILKRKKFTTVVVIDERLERLGAEVLSAQRDKLEILRRIDEIHGLLVDLLR